MGTTADQSLAGVLLGLAADHADRVGAFDGLTVQGLTGQRALLGITRKTGFPQTEVEHQIGVTIAVYIFLVAPGYSTLNVHVGLTGPFERDLGVVHGGGVKVFGGQDGYRDNAATGAVDRISIAYRLDVDLDSSYRITRRH